MMEKSFVFDSINGDRKYKAEDFREYFRSFIGNGVFPNPSNNLQVVVDSAMNVIIKKGKAWINGSLYINTEDYIIPITPADGVLSRIDRITLRMGVVERNIHAYVKIGLFSSNPVPQQLQRDADAYEIALADIKINKGIISITQADITDLRFNNSLCGVVHGTVDQVDVTTLFNQYNDKLSQKEVAFEAEFQAWFNTIKGQLSGDVAANLSKQITDINNKLGTEELTTTKKTLTGAVNEVTSLMGEMTSLQTTVKTNLVGAINEVNTNKVAKNDYVANNAFATTSGTSTAYTITLNPVPSAYVDGMQITILPHVDCGATPTLNINGLGALTIVKQDGSAIASGDIKANKPLSLVRVGSNFFIRSGGGIDKIKLSGLISQLNASQVMNGYQYGTNGGKDLYKKDLKTGAFIWTKTTSSYRVLSGNDFLYVTVGNPSTSISIYNASDNSFVKSISLNSNTGVSSCQDAIISDDNLYVYVGGYNSTNANYGIAKIRISDSALIWYSPCVISNSVKLFRYNNKFYYCNNTGSTLGVLREWDSTGFVSSTNFAYLDNLSQVALIVREAILV